MNKQFDDAYALITSEGWLSQGEARLLYSIATYVEGWLLEVGCYQGRSSMLLAQTGKDLICIDPWDDHFHSDHSGEHIYDLFWQHINSLPDPKNVLAIRCKVEDWEPIAMYQGRPCGLAYLDGDHTPQGTCIQIQKALLCSPQAIAIHDVNDGGDGLLIKQVALEMLGNWQIRVDRLAIWKMK